MWIGVREVVVGAASAGVVSPAKRRALVAPPEKGGGADHARTVDADARVLAGGRMRGAIVVKRFTLL